MIKKSIDSIPNGQIQRLKISLMEILALGNIIRSAHSRMIRGADHYINEQLVIQLYQKLADQKGWISFYDQLDEFYEACLNNKIENESVYYFYAPKMTVNECINFMKSYQSQKESRISRHYNYTRRKYQKELYGFNKMAQQKNWSEEELYKNRKNSYQEFLSSNQEFNSQIDANRKFTAQLLESLDHQLFHGSRMTIEFTHTNDNSITEQFDNIIESDWSVDNLRKNTREELRKYKDLIKQARRDIIYDIDQQLVFEYKNRGRKNIKSGRYPEFNENDTDCYEDFDNEDYDGEDDLLNHSCP